MWRISNVNFPIHWRNVSNTYTIILALFFFILDQILSNICSIVNKSFQKCWFRVVCSDLSFFKELLIIVTYCLEITPKLSILKWHTYILSVKKSEWGYSLVSFSVSASYKLHSRCQRGPSHLKFLLWQKESTSKDLTVIVGKI